MYLTQGLHRALQKHPDKVAVICGARETTFRALADRVARLAAGLKSLAEGRQPPRVAILSLNSDHYLEAYLAIAWMGGVAVPVNSRWSAPEIAFSLNDAGVDLLLIGPEFMGLAAGLCADCPSLRCLVAVGGTPPSGGAASLEALIAQHPPMPDTRAGGETLFGIFYTGGTTGRAKGVMLTHTNLLSSGLAALGAGPFGEGAVSLHVAPMFHLADMLLLSATLLRGGTHVILPAFDPARMIQTIETHHVTDTLIVPAMLAAVVNHPQIGARNLSSLRYLLYGASPAPETLLRQTLEKLPHVNLIQGYGMTESAALICFLLPDAHRDTANAHRLRSAGQAALDVEVRIFDAAGHEVQAGEIGEIACRGPNVMQGYWGMEEATRETIRNGWLHTGDVGKMDDAGFVYIVDRAKDMIISGGENVYSSEVENVIAAHPAVAAVAVIGIPDEAMGERVHAAVVLRAGVSGLSLEDLQAHCRLRLAGYKLPRSMEILQALPMSGAGKVLKTEIRKPHWAGRDRGVN
jgi:long-chain acyl-CoA synthetase